MKKVIEVSIGGVNFMIDDDAYYRLKSYLTRFESTIIDKSEVKEVMEDVEARVAEILQKELNYLNQTVDMRLINLVISHLGEIDESQSFNEDTSESRDSEHIGVKRFYRDPDDKKIAGVCGGLSAYFNIDVTLIRIVFFAALIAYGSALILYIILWIATKEALTVPQKLEMKGIPVTAENIRKFTSRNR